jgi:hypothetical protein
VMVLDQAVKMLGEAVSALRAPEVLFGAVRVLMESSRLVGLEAIIVLDQACGGHMHAYKRYESACRGSKVLLEALLVLLLAVRVLMESVRVLGGWRP